jgi:hypothetical protein
VSDGRSRDILRDKNMAAISRLRLKGYTPPTATHDRDMPQ